MQNDISLIWQDGNEKEKQRIDDGMFCIFEVIKMLLFYYSQNIINVYHNESLLIMRIFFIAFSCGSSCCVHLVEAFCHIMRSFNAKELNTFPPQNKKTLMKRTQKSKTSNSNV